MSIASAGVLNVAKPAGMMSRRVVDRVLSLVAPAKVGHAGTLDPMATGVLVVCIGPGTRLIPFIQEQSKLYVAEFLFGCTSDTDDVTGKVTSIASAAEIPRLSVEAALAPFVGRITQTPPDYSAARVEGQRAYHLARKGKAVDLAPRTVEVLRITILDYCWPRLRVEIECGSGTYIRSIGRDLGEALGCGAVMSQLERRRIGRFTLEDAVPFEQINATTLLTAMQPLTAGVAQYPSVCISDAQIASLRQGQQIAVAEGNLSQDDRLVSCLDDAGQLIALCEPDRLTHRLQPKVVIPAPARRVDG